MGGQNKVLIIGLITQKRIFKRVKRTKYSILSGINALLCKTKQQEVFIGLTLTCISSMFALRTFISDLDFLKLYCYFINFLFLYIYEYVRWKS